MDNNYVIKDLERLSGIKAHTLRIWEQRYNILKPKRTDTNIRYYSADDLKRILNVSLLNNNGYKISKIATLLDSELIKHAHVILNSFKNEGDQLDSLVLCTIEMNELKFEKTISDCVIHFGFRNTMEKVVFPFLNQVGVMWQMGLINTIQEHFISQLIRRKLIVGIDNLDYQKSANPKTFLLYLPNNELHELGLLYCHFLIKEKGHACFYLGQSVPIEDLKKINDITSIDVVLTSFTNPMEEYDLADYLKEVSLIFKTKQVLVSGRLALEQKEKLNTPKNICILQSYQELQNLL